MYEISHNQGCESSNFNLISDFFALHKPHFQTFIALKSTSFQACQIISDFFSHYALTPLHNRQICIFRFTPQITPIPQSTHQIVCSQTSIKTSANIVFALISFLPPPPPPCLFILISSLRCLNISPKLFMACLHLDSRFKRS